jgi:hypothetical protein
LLPDGLVTPKGVANSDLIVGAGVNERKHISIGGFQPVSETLFEFAFRRESQPLQSLGWIAAFFEEIKYVKRIQRARDQALRHPSAAKNLSRHGEDEPAIAVAANDIEDRFRGGVRRRLVSSNGHRDAL